MGWLKNLQNLRFKDLDPFNKNSQLRENLRDIDKQVFQPIWEQILDPLLLDPVARAYIDFVETQARGKYKPLPLWLKLVLQKMDIYDFDLTRVFYAEGINTLQEDNAITFGYNIHFPRAINLDRFDWNARDDIHWLLHEMEHVAQYKALGGVTAFVYKYIVQAGVGTLEQLGKSWTDFVNKIHDNIPIEVDAEAKADKYIEQFLIARDELPLDRPTTERRNLGSQISLNNDTMYEGDYLTSDNGLYRFILQADGNVVLYEQGMKVVWASYTDGMGKPDYRIVAQADGNVVQYDGYNTPDRALWKTGTNGLGGQVLILQDDRNLVIYASGNRPVWESHTYPGAQ